MSWISVDKELPPTRIRVDLSYGLFGIRGAVCDTWVSEGWLLPSGTWSVKTNDNVGKLAKPTHWKYKKPVDPNFYGIIKIDETT